MSLAVILERTLIGGANLLGIDSVMQPYEKRVEAWNRLATDLPMDKLRAMMSTATLAELPQLGRDILKGRCAQEWLLT